MPTAKPDTSLSINALPVETRSLALEPDLKHRFTSRFEDKLGWAFASKMAKALFEGADVLTDYSPYLRASVESALTDNLQYLARQRILSWAAELDTLPEYKPITSYFQKPTNTEPPFLDEKHVETLIESLWSGLPDALRLEAKRKNWLTTVRRAVKSAIIEVIEDLEQERIVNAAARLFPEEDAKMMFTLLRNHPNVDPAEARRHKESHPHRDIETIFVELKSPSLMRWCGDTLNWLVMRRAKN